MTPTATLVAIARNECRALLEWIAWHRCLGFGRIVVYDNASDDGSAGLLAALHDANEIVHVPWPDVAGRQAQLPAYADALERSTTEWICFLDLDEFLVLHDHPQLSAWLATFGPEVGAVAISQSVFGCNGLDAYDDRLVIERFTRCAPESLYFNGWCKTIARAADVIEPAIHACTLRRGIVVNPAGDAVTLLDDERQPEITHAVAQVNHYILKSREEYGWKRARGVANWPRGAVDSSARYTDSFFAAHDRNDIVDDSAARHAPEIASAVARLRAIVA